MRLDFPKEPEAWAVFVERLMTDLRIDYDRLWRMSPQVPQPVGVPFTGSLSPNVFCWPNQDCALPSGSVSGNLLCDATDICFTLSGVEEGASGTRNDIVCDGFNGTFHLRRTGISATSCLFQRTGSQTWWNGVQNRVVELSFSFLIPPGFIVLRFRNNTGSETYVSYGISAIAPTQSWPIVLTRNQAGESSPAGCAGLPDTVTVYDCSDTGSGTQP